MPSPDRMSLVTAADDLARRLNATLDQLAEAGVEAMGVVAWVPNEAPGRVTLQLKFFPLPPRKTS